VFVDVRWSCGVYVIDYGIAVVAGVIAIVVDYAICV